MSDDPAAASPEPTPTPAGPEKPSVQPVKGRYRREDVPLPADEATPASRRVPLGGTVSDPDGGFSDGDDVEREIEMLNARLRALSARKGTASTASEPEGRGAKYHKLTRKAAAPAVRNLAVPEPAAPVNLPAPYPVMYQVAGYQTAWNPGWLLATAGVLVLGVTAFMLGRLSIKPVASKVAVPVSVPSWSQSDIDRLDKVFAADAAGKLTDAHVQAKILSKDVDARPDLSRYMSLVQARRGSPNDAEADLVRAANAPLPPLVTAAIQNHLGFIYARRRDFKASSEAFANSAAADPFNAETFYLWGESLRRQGRLTEATDKFQEALLRLPASLPENDGLRQCAAFRQRLAQIELGRDADVKAALDAQLGLPAPSIYWLLTGLAYRLQHNDLPGALATVQRAKVVAPPALVELLLNDYYLRSLASRRQETAGFVPEMTVDRKHRLEAGMAYFIDP